MNKRKALLGIDLGTSSVKLAMYYENGANVKSKASYEESSPKGWWYAILRAMDRLPLQDVKAIGLSSQVGTYLTDEGHVISWNSPLGKEEVETVKSAFSKQEFIEEISMPHPDIVSYPIPRIRYIMKNYPTVRRICQPKEYLCEMLTGNCVTDPYSWRGLANLETGRYSLRFLTWLGVTEQMLPTMVPYNSEAGKTKKIDGCDLPEGIPVYVGLNDYYAALLGMGIDTAGSMFDITGTSEHLGIIEQKMTTDTPMVSGPYLTENVHYGVTASSGASLDFALRLWERGRVNIEKMLHARPPIFLPYLNGERAPIWDGEACGMFFGIEGGCTKEELCYAVMEGVTFSLYHIYEHMGMPKADAMCIAGGASVNRTLNELKAEMFGIPVYTLQDNDTSALGAAMVAGLGCGEYNSLQDAISRCCEKENEITPTGSYRDFLMERYAIYKELYPATEQQMKAIRRTRR